ncbi:MAG: 2-phospho-L-lactate guanylyltransferase [Actinomycetota bacterium]
MQPYDAGLLPVKELSRAKSRLGRHFADEDREEIARALLHDALELCASSDFLRWSVLSADDEVLLAAADRGLGVIPEKTAGLNAGIAGAVAQIVAEGPASLTIVHADIPLAWRGDLVDILDTGATSDIVVVPSRRDGGTNALYMQPAGAIEPQFGAGSLMAHVRLAERLGLRCSMLSLPRVALDIDTLDDVDAFLDARRPAPTRTAEVLTRLRSHAS